MNYRYQLLTPTSPVLIHSSAHLMVLTLLLNVTFNTCSYYDFVLYVFSWRGVRGLTSPATANKPMVDALFYFVTF